MYWFYILLIAIFLIPSPSILAQSCPTVVQQALSEMGTNCANMDHNTVCYGYFGIDATFDEEITDEITFEQPADRASLTPLRNIISQPLDEETGIWGLAVMKTNANIPNTLPGQGVIFIMIGDISITNFVTDEDSTYVPDVFVEVTVRMDEASLLSNPPEWGNHRSDVINTVSIGETFNADAITEDGQWLRIEFISERSETHNLATAWINIDDITTIDINGLAVINSDSRSPLQVFAIESGVVQPLCQEMPEHQVIIQGPSALEVDLYSNGLYFRLTSTMSVHILPDCLMTLTPITGGITIPNADDPDDLEANIIVRAGQELRIQLIRNEETGFCELSEDWYDNYYQIKTDFDLATESGENFINAQKVEVLALLQQIPDNILNYSLDDNTPIIIQASGVGNPVPIFDTFNPGE